ncbi:CHAT domain-containing tetratricopeptide repeat protein [Nocardia takedensis]|uniref:CHAT domain-containing tetratricopeptide repeat protein n=1 Tax=Nocardia takedensis TaxID=259390 RepID=UPI001C3F1E8A|nr:CHAT domain-containing protein [Nocardia takedensis]
MRTGSTADLNEAIGAGRQAITVSGPDDPGLTALYANLGAALQKRFEGAGDVTDLNEAIEVLEQAVIWHSDAFDQAAILTNLGAALNLRYEITGSVEDADRAIHTARRAVEATPSAHPESATRLTNLGNALHGRYLRTAMLADLNEAIAVVQEAATVCPPGSPYRATILSNLSAIQRLRFRRSSAMQDLNDAIDVGRQSVAATASNHPLRTAALTNLASALSIRYEQSGATADLDEALELARKVGTGPVSMHHALTQLNNLGTILRMRFSQTGVAADLDEAIELAQELVDSKPPGYLDHGLYHCNLGVGLSMRFERSRSKEDRNRAIEAYRTAAAAEWAPPWRRIEAARAAAELLASSAPQMAAELLAQAVRLLPEVAPHRLRRSDRQYQIGRFAQLAADSAALTLSSTEISLPERAESALKLLELGRAVIMGQLLNLRGETSRLEESEPDLAADFINLRDLLNTEAATTDATPQTDRQQIAELLEQTLERIRERPGFESFAKPPELVELLSQAAYGPIVTINISRHRSDALIATSTAVSCLPLPALDIKTVTDRASEFQHIHHAAQYAVTLSLRRAAQQRLHEILQWLWDAIAGPVLDMLGYRDRPQAGQPWPRLWWVTSGALGQLPLHAAGYHSNFPDPDNRSVIDRVVSSYTPTITALRHARSGTTQLRSWEALVVVVPTTSDNQDELDYAVEEAASVVARLPGSTVLTGPRDSDEPIAPALLPTKANVLNALAAYPVAHFACHGVNDAVDPSRSRLLLHDHVSTPFTVADLDPLRLNFARLAYLSACETATTTTPELLDEAIHLASAFQLAGYPQVVGTLATVDDRIAAEIAARFYHALPGGARPEFDHGAHALHQAVTAIRNQYPANPSLWTAHLHTGM